MQSLLKKQINYFSFCNIYKPVVSSDKEAIRFPIAVTKYLTGSSYLGEEFI